MRLPTPALAGALLATGALVLAGCSATTAPASAPASPTSAAPSTSGQTALRPYVLPGKDVFPEGITGRGSTFYVTSTTDGTVFRGTVGTPALTSFLAPGQDGRSTAVGLDVSADGTRLVVAGGATGMVWVYDTADGALVASFSDGLGEGATFLNDVAITPDGDAYVTDSTSPQLFRIPAAAVTGADGGAQGQALAPFVDFTGSALTYGTGFNANGIVTTADGSALVLVQSATGQLYRVGLADRAVRQVDLGGQTVVDGDGMELPAGGPLYVVRNADGVIAEVDLAADGTTGTVSGTRLTDSTFAYPTATAVLDGQQLVVNSQLDQRGGTPTEPFTISALRR